ncbi:MAG: GNAT family protein [Chloroflexota bacterium]
MLQGERVTLRAITEDDLESLWRFNNDLEVELAGGGDPPMPQALARLQASYQAKLSHGDRDGTEFAIEADNLFIGHCALFRFDHVARTCELGITIGDRNFWGQGYGREAVRLLLDYGFRYHNLHRIFLSVNGNNERAIRAYNACGFVKEGQLRSHVWHDNGYVDLLFMGILREEWISLSSS